MIRKILNFLNINTAKKDLLGGVKQAFMSGNIKTDFNFESFASKNIFNHLSKKSEYGFYYWPYGYLFRHVKWGGINELGFRNEFNFDEVDKKFSNFYKIGFFGGSTGFDVLVKKEDTLVYKLEKKLNRENIIKEKFGQVKIINFSQPGNMLLNQIINYIQFAQLSKLNMVISHNPANDYATSLMNDPVLVKKYKIGYVDILEAFSRKIHDADDIEIDCIYMDVNSKDFKPVDSKTSPEVVIESYLFRIKQFQNIVESQKQVFISGYQPFVYSKKNLSINEKEKLKNYNMYYSKIYSKIPILYEIFEKKFKHQIRNMNFLNLHNEFENLDNKVDHFGDVVHLLEAGNEVSAESYKKFIVNLLKK